MALPGILIGAGTGLGALATLFGGRKAPNLGELESKFGPEAVAQRQRLLFNLLVGSPAFQAMLKRTNVAGQQAGQAINANLAKAGLDTTGVGAVAAGLGEAAGGFGREGLIASASQQAGEQAINLNELLARLYSGFKSQEMQTGSPLQMLGGGLLSALGPAALDYFKKDKGSQQQQTGAWGVGLGG